MEKYLLRKEAEEKRKGAEKRSWIVTNEMIAIFMAFLTYGKDNRRDFLRYDMTIEDEFLAEAEIKANV